MKVRLVTSRACGFRLLCASLLIHNFVGAAPQGFVNGASFTSDNQKIFNDFTDLSGHSGGLVLPAVQLKGPNFITAPDHTVFISQPQEPQKSISQTQTSISQPQTFISQPQQPQISISQPQQPQISISQPQSPHISISQTSETFQPPEPTISFSQTQSTNRNSQPAASPVSQQALFINQQPPTNDFFNPQPAAPVQQPEFISRSQPSTNPPQQQNSFNSQPFLVKAVQESATLIRDGETVHLPHESVSVGNSINQVESVNKINNVGKPTVSIGGQSPIVSLFPEDKVVELPIPFLGAGNQNQLQQNHNSFQQQSTFVDSSGKTLNTINSINTQTDNFVKRGPQNFAPSGGSNIIGVPLPSGGSNNIGISLPSGGQNSIGIPLTSVVKSISGNNNAGVPISATINSNNGNTNIGTPKATLSNTVSEVPLTSTVNVVSQDNTLKSSQTPVPLTSTVNVASQDNTLKFSQSPVPLTSTVNIASQDNTLKTSQNLVPLTSTVHVASEDNILRSSQSPVNSVGVSLSSAINADNNIGTSVSSDIDTNTGSDIGSLTLGEVLLSMNGQDGIIVLPMDDLKGSTISELMDANDNQNITFRADEGTSDGDLGALLDTFISDYADTSEFDDLPPAPPSPPNIFRGTLADTLFVKGQWLGTLLGGLVDLGGAISGSLKEFKQKS